MTGRPRSEVREVAEKVRLMTEQGFGVPAIAEAIGVHERTVSRHRAKLGIAQGACTEPTPEQVLWLHAMREEGMPAKWVAETIGVKPDTVRRRHGMTDSARRDWLKTWSSIRRNPALLALHREFSAGDLEARAAA